MSAPADDSAFLRALEQGVRAELAFSATSQPGEENVGVPIDEWLFDPVDAQREEVGLRNLLGAIEAMEDGSRSGPHDVPSAASAALSGIRSAAGPPAVARRPRTGQRPGPQGEQGSPTE